MFKKRHFICQCARFLFLSGHNLMIVENNKRSWIKMCIKVHGPLGTRQFPHWYKVPYIDFNWKWRRTVGKASSVTPHLLFLWDLFLWKSHQRMRDVWFCKVRCSKCDETMADISNFCIKCKTKLEIGRTVMKKAEDQVDNYNLVESWVLMVKSSKSRSQSWKRVPIVQICVRQRFENLSRNPIIYCSNNMMFQ